MNTDNAWGEWAEESIEKGWSPFLLSITFHQMSGTKKAKLQIMKEDIGGLYRRTLTRAVRNPRSKQSIGSMPIFICAPDLPVYKRNKRTISKFDVNDGLHWHAIALIPPTSRMKDYAEEMKEKPYHFISRDSQIFEVDIEPIVDDIAYVTNYALKGILRKRVDIGEDIVIYPVSYSEMKKG